jgi:para-nitrobenzyl esterase
MHRIVFLVFLLCCPPAAALEGARVTLPAQGELRGVVAGDVAVFRNIPYAAPPVGALRWRPPQTPSPWVGERDASAFGPACIQMWQGAAPQGESEDCLSLNIWAPRTADAALKPVIVWIHGGAFKLGTGGTELHDGSRYARRGVVVVTLNYRLGWLGFFAHPALKPAPGEAAGNYGIMDQIAALEWVRDNIALFGGDFNRVTIAGESAGAISVDILMVSPEARGLFAGAIAQSGFGRNRLQAIAGVAGPTAETDGRAFAQALGIAGEGADAMAALRALPAEAFATAPPNILGAPSVMVDGVVMPEQVEAAFARGAQAGVPYITGGTSWEASLMPALTAYPGWLAGRIAAADPAIAELYGFATNPNQAAADFITDFYETEPDRHLARLHAQAGHPAFVYRFSYLPLAQRGTLPGVMHGLDVFYTFGTLPQRDLLLYGVPIPAETPPDRAISEAMIAYWSGFAIHGAPGHAGGPAWPAVTYGRDPVLDFGADGPYVHAAFAPARLDAVERLHAIEGWVPW